MVHRCVFAPQDGPKPASTRCLGCLSLSLLAFTALLASAAPSLAQFVPASAKAGPAPSVDGDGLNGAFWNAPADVADLAAAFTIIGAGAPTATFNVTTVDYPNGTDATVPDNTSLSNFLGGDASSLSGAGGDAVETSVFRFTGYGRVLDSFDTDPVAAGIQVPIEVGSDDGFRLTIGGVQISEFVGQRPFGVTPALLTFEEAGLYSLDLVYYENFGVTGIELTSGSTIIPTLNLYRTVPGTNPVPEPGTFALLGGVTAVSLLLRKRRH